MFDAILNRIAERSQALKDKDAEIAVWQETAMEQESHIKGFIADSKTYSTRIREKQASLDRAEARIQTLVKSADGEPSRNLNLRARAEAAESQLMQIAEALDIEVGPAGALGQAMEAAEEVERANADIMAADEAAELAAEVPATEG